MQIFVLYHRSEDHVQQHAQIVADSAREHEEMPDAMHVAAPERVKDDAARIADAARDVQELGKLHADYCFNCGSCSFVCPAKRPVTQMMSLAKAFYLGEIKKGGNK